MPHMMIFWRKLELGSIPFRFSLELKRNSQFLLSHGLRLTVLLSKSKRMFREPPEQLLDSASISPACFFFCFGGSPFVGGFKGKSKGTPGFWGRGYSQNKTPASGWGSILSWKKIANANFFRSARAGTSLHVETRRRSAGKESGLDPLLGEMREILGTHSSEEGLLTPEFPTALLRSE